MFEQVQQQDEKPPGQRSSAAMLKQKMAQGISSRIKKVANNPQIQEEPSQRRAKTARGGGVSARETQHQANKSMQSKQQEQQEMEDWMLKANEKHAFTEKDMEIEHLRKELTIIHKKALVIDDIQN